MVILAVVIASMVAAVVTGIATSHSALGGPLAPRVSHEKIVESVEQHPRLEHALQHSVEPGTATGVALTFAAVAAALCIGSMGALLVMVQTNTGLEHFDLAFARWGASHSSDVSTRVLVNISQLGGTALIVQLTVLFAVVELRRTKKMTVVALLAVVVGGQFAVSNLIKLLVGRPRPALAQLTGFSGSSFPSGHAMTAAACYSAFVLVLGVRRSRRVRIALASGAGAIIGAVASTRVLLGVHWFTDVLAGVFAGWGWFAICSIAFGGRLLHFGEPVEDAESIAEAADTR